MPVFSIIDCKILRSDYCTYQESVKEKSIHSLDNFPVTFIRYMLCICQKKKLKKDQFNPYFNVLLLLIPNKNAKN